MLILQGGRDYQVTVDDDLSRWKAALGNRPDVTIRVYDADNHLFFPGSGPSSPGVRTRPAHGPRGHRRHRELARSPETDSLPKILNRIRFQAVLPGAVLVTVSGDQ